jgi:hypothetical protein
MTPTVTDGTYASRLGDARAVPLAKMTTLTDEVLSGLERLVPAESPATQTPVPVSAFNSAI